MNTGLQRAMLIYSILIVVIGSGCIGKRAIGLVEPIPNDVNERRAVKSALFERKINAVGMGGIALSTAATAYIGYNSNLVSSYKDGEVSTNKPLNAMVGGGVGFGISYVINYSAKGKEKDLHSRLKNKGETITWVNKKLGNDFQVIIGNDELGFDNFKVVPKEKEEDFVFFNRGDFYDFDNAFSNSPMYVVNFEKNLINSFASLSKDDLVWVYQSKMNGLTPLTKEKVENSIFDKSRSIKSLAETARIIPRLREEAGKKAYSMASKISDYGEIRIGFPELGERAKNDAFLLVKDFRTVIEFKENFPKHHKELLIKAEQLLSGNELYMLGDAFEVRCVSIMPYESRIFHSYLPPYSYSVATIKEVESSKFSFTGNRITSTSIYEENVTPIDADFLKYSLQVIQSDFNGKILSFEIENHDANNSLKFLSSQRT